MTTKVVIVLTLLVVVMAALAALFLVRATDGGREWLMDVVVSNVDGHPTLDGVVHKIPNDCLECHQRESHAGAFSE